MVNANIPQPANQSLTSNFIKGVGQAAKITGAGLVIGGFLGGLPAVMSIGSLLGATGTGIGWGSKVLSGEGLSLSRALSI